MNKFSKLCLLGALGLGVQVQAADVCQVILCQDGCYKGNYPPNSLPDNRCDKSLPDGNVERTFSIYSPPDPVMVYCEPLSGGFLCEAYPTGTDFSYGWSPNGPLTIPYPGSAQDNAQFIACSGSGTLTVTVMSPSGTVASKDKFLPCGPGGY